MLRIKEGVRVLGLKPEILVAVHVAADAFTSRNVDAWITSAIDGEHMERSLHYKGLAVDFRIRYLGLSVQDIRDIVGEIKVALGDDYDVVLMETHIHIEYDPKKPL